MDFERADGPLARAFEGELKRHHGRIGATEIALGYNRGHFSRLFREELPIKIDLILRALDLLGVDHGEFFARAYDISLIPEVMLGLHARSHLVEPELCRIEKVVQRLETEEPPRAGSLQGRDFRPRLETYWRDEAGYQRKHLAKTKMFRQPAFVTAYLERLDALRYERPKDAAKVAAGVVTLLLPLVPADRKQIIGFACKAIGIYASGHRQSLGFATAAAAIVVGLKLAGRHGLELERAELLQRGAFVLSDHGEFDRALGLLMKAQTEYSDQNFQPGLGKVLVDRGVVHSNKKEYAKSVQLFLRALEYIPARDFDLQRWWLSAYNGMALAYRELGRLDLAEEHIMHAIESYGDAEDGISARLWWQLGAILYCRGEGEGGEQLLKRAQVVFLRCENPVQSALVSLDLASMLLAQVKLVELSQLVKSMAPLLNQFRHNPIAEAALAEFFRAGLAGRITQTLIDEVRKEIAKDVPSNEYALKESSSSRSARCSAPKPPAPSKGHRRPGARGPDGNSRT